jgi:ABC-2 type transport system permease protein
MRVERIATIARREYLAGVRTKGFWISTVAVPLLMAAMLVLPALLLARTRATLRVVVVDGGGRLGERLAAELADEREPAAPRGPESDLSGRPKREEAARFAVEVRAAGADADAEREALDREVVAGTIDAWIRLDAGTLSGDKVPYHGESVSNFVTQRVLAGALTRVVSEARLADAGIDPGAVAALTREVELETVRVSAEGARAETGMTGFMMAYFLFLLLYMATLLYGQQVMNGVLEEKSSRVVEVVLTIARPAELMAGKLFGICAVGLTQLGIWFATLLALTAPGLAASLFSLPAGVTLPSLSLGVTIHFLAHFVLGFLLFASLYAAIGAASNDLREAQQLASGMVILLVLPAVMAVTVINDPDSVQATVMSLIPLFTPLLMLLRIVVKTPPLWQIALGYALTAAFVALLLALCARVYRVGILMYGKRPTLAELGRWIRHS